MLGYRRDFCCCISHLIFSEVQINGVNVQFSPFLTIPLFKKDFKVFNELLHKASLQSFRDRVHH